jgi:hypothetical protein
MHIFTAKFTHKRIPTNGFLHQQQQRIANKCPRCALYQETSDHILICKESSTGNNKQQTQFYHVPEELVKKTCLVSMPSMLEKKN